MQIMRRFREDQEAGNGKDSSPDIEVASVVAKNVEVDAEKDNLIAIVEALELAKYTYFYDLRAL